MKRLFISLAVLAILLLHAPAVEQGGVYQTSQPTVTGWNSGWGAPTVTGWNYVGTVNGASGVYLGNGWVLTAGHVGAGTFTLKGTAYAAVNGSARAISDADGIADISLFKIASVPALTPLTLATQVYVDQQVVMIGYGGGHGETWGSNTLAALGLVTLTGPYSTPLGIVASFNTVDYQAPYGANAGKLVGGDSGGADFIYDTATGQWQLAGINEAIDGDGNSYLVDLGYYASAIENITEIPEPTPWALLGVGAALLFVRRQTRVGFHPRAHFTPVAKTV